MFRWDSMGMRPKTKGDADVIILVTLTSLSTKFITERGGRARPSAVLWPGLRP